MGNPKSCIIYAYPSKDSIHGSRFLQTITETLETDKIPYEILDLYEMNFNPVLSSQELQNYGKSVPEQIQKIQSLLKSSNSWIFIYPSWWSSPPAILKGFFDRIFTPGFSHRLENGKVIPLLHDHQALILHTFSYSAAQEQKSGKVGTGYLGFAILNPCGVASDEIDVYSIDTLPPSAFEHTLKYVPGAVRRSLTKPTGVPHHLRSIPAPYLPPVLDKGDVLKEERAKKEKALSKDALADLNFFRKARKVAREGVHRRSDQATSTRYRFENNDSDFHPSHSRDSSHPLRRAPERRYSSSRNSDSGYTGRRDSDRGPDSGYLGRSDSGRRDSPRHSDSGRRPDSSSRRPDSSYSSRRQDSGRRQFSSPRQKPNKNAPRHKRR